MTEAEPRALPVLKSRHVHRVDVLGVGLVYIF